MESIPPRGGVPGLARRLELPLWALLFGLAYSQAPLYTSNQNQYFLHGAARAGIGDLAGDWLANTADSVPLFSLLVEAVYRTLPPGVFYLIYLGLMGVYLLSLTDLSARIFDLQRPAARRLFLAGMILTHSAALRYAVRSVFGGPWDYLLDGGVAGERLLGPVLQPSSFGVLLLLSMALFLRHRPYLAVLAAVLAASIHPTYLLASAALTLAYLWVLWRERRGWRTPLAVGLLALVLVAPITLYYALALPPTSPQLFAEAEALLVDFRVPHHALVAEWLDATVWVKLGLMAAALVFSRRSRLFAAVVSCTAIGLGLTLIQVVTASDTLAVFLPWRMSTVLVPLGTALLVAWSAAALGGPLLQRLGPRGGLLAAGCWALAVALAAAGLARFAFDLHQLETDPARPMLEFVAAGRRPGEVYLIPPRLQEFRLATGAAALVDFKSIPYRDVEFLAWYERQRLAEWFYRDRVEYVDCGLLDRIAAEYGVSHVVLNQPLLELSCPAFGRRLFADDHYAVVSLAIP